MADIGPLRLQADLQIRRGDFDLDLSLAVAPGEVVVLLGPNGAGKSTTLRLLAGLLPLDRGTVELGGETVEDTSAGVRRPPEQRRVGVVFQDYLLFPGMTVRENVAFGLRARGVSRHLARRTADDWLARVGLTTRAGQRPAQLSGGQAQRVALARALAADPQVLLLDEPLSALDAGTRVEVRSDLHGHLSEFAGAAVVVTHDPVDAMVLGDRLVVLEGGRVVQLGAPREVATRPRTDYVARLVGLNLLRDKGAQGQLMAFPPSAVELRQGASTLGDGLWWRCRVVTLETHGDSVRVRLGGEVELTADVPPVEAAELGLRPGSDVRAGVRLAEITRYAG